MLTFPSFPLTRAHQLNHKALTGSAGFPAGRGKLGGNGSPTGSASVSIHRVNTSPSELGLECVNSSLVSSKPDLNFQQTILTLPLEHHHYASRVKFAKDHPPGFTYTAYRTTKKKPPN